MVEDVIQGALDALRAERDQIDKAISVLELTSSVELAKQAGQRGTAWRRPVAAGRAHLSRI